jgi:hypothetical protein
MGRLFGVYHDDIAYAGGAHLALSGEARDMGIASKTVQVYTSFIFQSGGDRQ